MAYGNAQRAWTYDEYVEKYNELQAELEKVKNLLSIAIVWMGTDDPDWDEVDMVKKEYEKLNKPCKENKLCL